MVGIDLGLYSHLCSKNTTEEAERIFPKVRTVPSLINQNENNKQLKLPGLKPCKFIRDICQKTCSDLFTLFGVKLESGKNLKLLHLSEK